MIDLLYLALSLVCSVLMAAAFTMSENSNAQGSALALIVTAGVLYVIHEKMLRIPYAKLVKAGQPIGVSRYAVGLFPIVITGLLAGDFLASAVSAYLSMDTSSFVSMSLLTLLVLTCGALCSTLLMRQQDLYDVAILANRDRPLNVSFSLFKKGTSIFIICAALLVPPMADNAASALSLSYGKIALIALSFTLWMVLTSKLTQGPRALKLVTSFGTYFPVLCLGALGDYIARAILGDNLSGWTIFAMIIGGIGAFLMATTSAVMPLLIYREWEKSKRYLDHA